MIKYLLIVSLAFFIKQSQAQLPNFNTYLIANLDNYESYSGLWGYTDSSGREYALLGCFAGTSIVDVTDSSNVYEVDYIPGIGSNWREIKTYSHYAYVVSEGPSSRIQIIDLQYLPDSVSLIETWGYSGFSYTHAISQSGPFLYLSGGNASPNGGVQIVDVSIPVSPVRRGNNSVRYVHDCRVKDDTIWACNIVNQRVTILNAENKDNIQEIRNFTTIQQFPHSCALSNDRKYIFITHESNNPGSLDVYNIENLENITFVTRWLPTNILTSPVHNVEIYDSLMFVSHYTAGVRIVDISNPAFPVEIAWYDTRPEDNSNNFLGCWGVFKFNSGKIIASDVTNGLFVIKTSFPTNSNQLSEKIEGYYLMQNYPNPFNPVTKIKFGIPRSGFVSLKIYDASGKEVSVLVNERKSNANVTGIYETEFDGSMLPSGVYFYSLIIDGKLAESKKMMLLK